MLLCYKNEHLTANLFSVFIELLVPRGILLFIKTCHNLLNPKMMDCCFSLWQNRSMAGISPRSGLSLVPTASCYTYTIYINTRINRMQMFRCALEAAKMKKNGSRTHSIHKMSCITY